MYSKINSVLIDNVEDLDVVMPMYKLLKYSKNYRKTIGSLRDYCRDEPNNPLSFNSESFKYKTIITGDTYNIAGGDDEYDEKRVGKNEIEIVVLLKTLSNFWRTLDVTLINCEIDLILSWSKNCVLADMTVRAAGNNDDLPVIVAPIGWEFQIKDTKLYVPSVSLSTKDDSKLLEQLKSRFKRTIKWNKNRSQMTIPTNNNNLNYLIDPAVTKVNRLFALSFERIAGENNQQKIIEILF